jgi:hypothetical protein
MYNKVKPFHDLYSFSPADEPFPFPNEVRLREKWSQAESYRCNEGDDYSASCSSYDFLFPQRLAFSKGKGLEFVDLSIRSLNSAHNCIM